MNILNIKNILKSPIIKSDYSDVKRRLILSYIIFVFFSLALIICLYFISMKSSRDEYWTQNKNILQSSVALFDNDLIIVDSYCRQLMQDINFTRIVKMSDASNSRFYINAYKAKATLPSHLYSYSQLPIDSFYIYLRENDYVLSVRKFESSYSYFINTMRNPLSSYNSWLQLMTENLTSGTFKDIHYKDTDKQTSYTYIVDLSSLSYRNIEATAAFVFDNEKTNAVFSELLFESDSFLIVVDENNEEQFRITKSNTEEMDTQMLMELTFKNSYSSYINDGMTMFVTRLTSSLNNWTYYLVQPSGISQGSTWLYNTIFTLFIIIFTLFSVFIILVLSRRHMIPIFKLDSQLKETLDAQNQLQEVVDFQKPYICNLYHRQLMLGTVSSDSEMDYIKDYLHLNEKNLEFNVLYATYYQTDDLHYPVSDLEDIIELVHKKLLFVFSEFTTSYLYTPSERAYALLIYYNKDTEEPLFKLQEILLRLHEELLEDYSIWLFAGVGLPASNLNNIWESYQQAHDMASYSTKNYIFLPYEVKEKNSQSYYYPPELSIKMTHFITNSNKKQLSELLHLIHQENIEERSLSANLLNFLLSDIRNTLIKVRFSIDTKEQPLLLALNQIDVLFNEPLTFRICEKIAIALCDVFSQKEESSSVIAAIQEYIKNHFNDPSMGLNKISDEFHISESYISHMFKESTGVNFSVYLEDIRLKEAIRLIRETDCNISELYLQVGYNSASTFRRAFKKRYGFAPSAVKNSL